MEAAVIKHLPKVLCLLICLITSCVSYSQTDSHIKLEEHILDKVARLKQVRVRSAYVEKQTKGKRHLQFTIWTRPTKTTPYYWVKVMEDNGMSYYTHFNFYVYPKGLKIKYLDTVNDRLIDVSKWKINY